LIITGNHFHLTFMVPQATPIRLQGEFDGCATIGCDNFVRVQLTRAGASIFNSTFGHTLPFETTLQPGSSYTLSVEASGRAFINDTTESHASITMFEITCTGDLDSDNDVDLSDLVILLANFGSTSPAGDIDGDADVDLTDLTTLLANFGATCE
jgi:hypothetical protein